MVAFEKEKLLFLCLFFAKPQTVQLCNERVPFVSFILPNCALIINSFMLKNSTWKNMLLRA